MALSRLPMLTMRCCGAKWTRRDLYFLDHVISFIDTFDDQKSEINYAGTEKRIWMSHEKDELIGKFRHFADRLISRIHGKQITSRDTLAIRNLPVEERSELHTGRWHLDSLRRQVKVFAFLTDVTERSGPLEIIPGSHRASFKFPQLLKGQLVGPTDLVLGDARKYQHLDDAWAERMASDVGGSTPLVCPAGTIAVVNTSAIHRARPCLEANRYALTSYYDHF
jgi:hypothetical protein